MAPGENEFDTPALEDSLNNLDYIFQTLMCIGIIWGSFSKCRDSRPRAGLKNVHF